MLKVLREAIKENLIIKQEKKANIEIFLQKLPKLMEEIENYKDKYIKGFQAKPNLI